MSTNRVGQGEIVKGFVSIKTFIVSTKWRFTQVCLAWTFWLLGVADGSSSQELMTHGCVPAEASFFFPLQIYS